MAPGNISHVCLPDTVGEELAPPFCCAQQSAAKNGLPPSLRCYNTDYSARSATGAGAYAAPVPRTRGRILWAPSPRSGRADKQTLLRAMLEE